MHLFRNTIKQWYAHFIVRQFHKLYYQNYPQTWDNTRWLGTKILKCPLDIWIYQEILFETRPDIIIETGTNCGGSALFLAHLCDHLKSGLVITIDIERFVNRPEHPRIRYLNGSSTSPNIIAAVKSAISNSDKVLVVLDSDHSEKHVFEEMCIYNQLVTLNSYMIVEDSNVNGHPVLMQHGPGPHEAIARFLKANPCFRIDREREKYFLTFNPDGYLKRIKQDAQL